MKNSLFLLLTLTFSLIGCGVGQRHASEVPTNDAAWSVQLPVRRIVALTPALTELLFVACADTQIVAVTPYCNFPPAALHKRKIQTLPLDIEGIVSLQPDVVVAEAGMHAPDALQRLQELGVSVRIVRLDSISHIIATIRQVGQWCNCTQKAYRYADSLQILLDSLKHLSFTHRPRVVALIWQQPIYVHGQKSLMTEKIVLAGGEPVVQLGNVPAPEVSREYLLQLNPDVLFGGTFAHLDTTFFRLYPELRRLKAYQTQQIYPLDPDLSSRPSPRVLSAVIEMQQKLALAK